MLTDILKELYVRDLAKLKTEVELYRDDADLWKTTGEIANSGGNLSLHMVGNLRHYFGAVLGGTGYVRDRDAEFASGNISRPEILAEIEAALKDVVSTLDGLSEEDLEANYPIEVFDRPMSTAYFFTHLATHFNYHLGQINYHRRLIS